jgi:hypothetical protein
MGRKKTNTRELYDEERKEGYEPQIGDDVLYHDGVTIQPAKITTIFNSHVVNLMVFQEAYQGLQTITSVVRGDSINQWQPSPRLLQQPLLDIETQDTEKADKD